MIENAFSGLGLSQELLKAIEDVGYTEMTEIQEHIIPHILAGKDLIGQSSTGTGKTAAFSIPAVEKTVPCAEGVEEEDPQVLVLAPTRELAIQITEEMQKFSKYKPGIKTVAVYGGQTIMIQIRALKNAQIVVGTPGRVIDHLNRGTMKLSNLKLVVLDEADEMLDMGFVDDIKYILRAAPQDRQTLLFSATMPPAILRMADRFLKRPELVKGDNGQTAFELITQYYVEVPSGKKANAVKLLMDQTNTQRALIFTNTKRMAEVLNDRLCELGLASVALHGDLRQSVRTKIMQDFKAGKANILIATDVAARGIDASGVEAIINYDIPEDIEFYVHRIGRTGRAGQLGASYTIIANKGELFSLVDIEDYTKAPLKPYFLEGAEDLPDDKVRATSNAKARNASPKGFGRGGASMKDNQDNVLVAVDVGSFHEVRPSHISGAIMKYARLKKQDIGKITIGEKESYVELNPENARLVMRTMQDATVNDFVVTFTAAKVNDAPTKTGNSRGGRSGGSRNGGNHGSRGGHRGGRGRR